MHKSLLPLFIFSLTVTLSACNTTLDATETQQPIGLANPASVYCAKLGGKSIPQKNKHGDYALCQLPDNQIIEEWTLYRRDHK